MSPSKGLRCAWKSACQVPVRDNDRLRRSRWQPTTTATSVLEDCIKLIAQRLEGYGLCLAGRYDSRGSCTEPVRPPVPNAATTPIATGEDCLPARELQAPAGQPRGRRRSTPTSSPPAVFCETKKIGDYAEKKRCCHGNAHGRNSLSPAWPAVHDRCCNRTTFWRLEFHSHDIVDTWSQHGHRPAAMPLH